MPKPDPPLISLHASAATTPVVDLGLLLAIVEGLPTIAYVYDVRERLSVFQNRPLGELLGYSPQQVAELGKDAWKRLIHPDDASRFPAHGDRLRELANGESVVFEYRMRHADGEWRWLLSRDTAFSRDADGQLRYVIGSTADITEQKRTEDRLRAQEEQQARLIDELDHRLKDLLAILQSLAPADRR